MSKTKERSDDTQVALPSIDTFLQALDDYLQSDDGSGKRRWQTMTCDGLYRIYHHNCNRMKEHWRGNSNRDFTAFLAESLVLRFVLAQLKEEPGEFRLEEQPMRGSEQRRFVADSAGFEIRANFRTYYDQSNNKSKRKYREPDIALWTTGEEQRVIGVVEVKANDGNQAAVNENLEPLRSKYGQFPTVVIAFGSFDDKESKGPPTFGVSLSGNTCTKFSDVLQRFLVEVGKHARLS